MMKQTFAPLLVGAGYDEDGFFNIPVAMLGGDYRVSRPAS